MRRPPCQAERACSLGLWLGMLTRRLAVAVGRRWALLLVARGQSAIGLKSNLLAPQSGQIQVSGSDSNGVPGATPESDHQRQGHRCARKRDSDSALSF